MPIRRDVIYLQQMQLDFRLCDLEKMFICLLKPVHSVYIQENHTAK